MYVTADICLNIPVTKEVLYCLLRELYLRNMLSGRGHNIFYFCILSYECSVNVFCCVCRSEPRHKMKVNDQPHASAS
jgi:hypothetical protein